MKNKMINDLTDALAFCGAYRTHGTSGIPPTLFMNKFARLIEDAEAVVASGDDVEECDGLERIVLEGLMMQRDDTLAALRGVNVSTSSAPETLNKYRTEIEKIDRMIHGIISPAVVIEHVGDIGKTTIPLADLVGLSDEEKHEADCQELEKSKLSELIDGDLWEESRRVKVTLTDGMQIEAHIENGKPCLSLTPEEKERGD